VICYVFYVFMFLSRLCNILWQHFNNKEQLLSLLRAFYNCIGDFVLLHATFYLAPFGKCSLTCNPCRLKAAVSYGLPATLCWNRTCV